MLSNTLKNYILVKTDLRLQMQSRDSIGGQGQSRALEGLPPKFVAAMR